MFLSEGIKNPHIKSYIEKWCVKNNLNEKKGGGLKKGENKITIKYDKYNFYFKIFINNSNDIYITVNNERYTSNCAIIEVFIDKHYATLEGIQGNVNCASPTLPIFGKGTILLNCIIDFIKNKLPEILNKKIKIEYIKLDDTSKKNCDQGTKVFSMYMSDFYILIEGIPWYYKFGFRNEESLANRDIENNKIIMSSIKVNNIDIKQIIINSLKNLKNKIIEAKSNSLKPNEKNIQKYNFLKDYKNELFEFFNQRNDMLLKKCIRELSENGENDEGCKLIYCIHQELMNYIGLISIKSKYNNDEYLLEL
jgi:hypothetical protein